MLPALLNLLLLPAFTLATPTLLERNLAYRSPYTNEPALGVDTRALHERHLAARHEIRDEIDNGLRKRQSQELAPEGSPSTYTYVGYGLGVADFGDASYVYAGNLNYTHSVASGDPYDYSVLLWTRAVPTENYRVDVPMCVEYMVYSGPNATGDVVSCGYALTNADVDFTVKVEATGLTASTSYSYQFSNCANFDNASPVGRTRTAPGKDATNVPTQRFSIYSCSNYPNGFFSAYSGPVVHQDTDYVVHLGDYIYESGSGGTAIGRVPSKGKELATLDDYRQRYSQYRTDIDLRSMHEQYPIIAIWDDHETADNDWKAGSTDSNDSLATGGCSYSNNTVCFTDREAHAKRAYHEWIPIRAVDLGDEKRIWREFNFGDLLDIVALDTRKYDRDITDVNYNRDYVAELAQQLNTSRSITGPKQEEWLKETLKSSSDKGTKWRLIMNQVIFGTINEQYASINPFAANAFVADYDAWDGYQAERQRILQYIYDNQIDNIAVFTGDTHANWLFENNLDTVWIGQTFPTLLPNISTTTNSYQRGQVVEFGGTAVSSSGWGIAFGSGKNATLGAESVVATNGGLLYAEGYYRGYMLAEVSYSNITVSYFGYPGNQQARVDQNRTLGFQAVQLADMNQVQRPLMTPTSGFGAIKEGN